MNTRKYSPATAVGLAAGAIFAVAFAVWNISQSLNPPAQPQSPPVATSAPTGPQTATPGGEPQSTQALTQTPAANVTQSVQTAAAPTSNQLPKPSGEAMLAPGADPFAPLTYAPVMQTPMMQPTQPIQQANAIANRALPTYGAGIQASPLSQQAMAALQARMKPAVVEIPTPELIGTLLGVRPSAVFRSKDGVVVVAAGEKFAGWKVARVVHGGVVLTHGKRKVTVGTSLAGAMIAEHEESRPVPARTQMAEIQAQPAPVVESTPDPFLVAEAVNVNKSNPIPVAEPVVTTPAPAPAPVEEAPAPAPPVVQETAPPPKPEGVKEEPVKKEPTR